MLDTITTDWMEVKFDHSYAFNVMPNISSVQILNDECEIKVYNPHLKIGSGEAGMVTLNKGSQLTVKFNISHETIMRFVALKGGLIKLRYSYLGKIKPYRQITEPFESSMQ